LRWNFAKGQTMTAGIESTRQRLESDTVYNATSRQLDSARLGYQGEFERHQVQLNVRQDKYSDFGTASTWFAGYGFRFARNWRVNGSSSTGFNAPTFNDLYYPYGGNPNLRPEQVSSSELGLQYATEVHDARAVWFSNRFTDLIGNDASFNRVNINQARNDGLELSYRGKYGATNVRAGMTLQNPVDLTSNKRLARRADTLANVGITRDIGPWSYGANLRYVGERPDGSNTLAAYSVLDLTVSHALNREVKLFGRIENLLDARYETVYGYNQPGLGVFVGLTWQPNV
jgi:vitamin B12 transporter